MSFDKKALIGFITEIEASRERAKGETRHQSDIFKRAREKQFDVKAMRKVLQRRAMSVQDRDSLDDAIDSYELALGSLALAKDAVDGGMSRREAAEKYNVPRAALGHVARGSQNAISDPPHDPDTGEINEIHRGATQPKGCAKAMRTDASMSESVAASGDAVRDASAMPLDVVAAPHSEGREHAGSAATAPPACVSGTHSGGDAQDIFAESAKNESCGGVEGSDNDPTQTRKTGNMPGSPGEEMSSSPSRLVGATVPEAAKAPRVGVVPDPHDTHSETHHGAVPEETKQPLQAAPPAILHASDCAVHNEPAYPAGPCDCGADPTRAENAQVGDTRGEARPNPPPISDAQALANLDAAEAIFFASRDRAGERQ